MSGHPTTRVGKPGHGAPKRSGGRPRSQRLGSGPLRAGVALGTGLVVATLAIGTILTLDHTRATALHAGRRSIERDAELAANAVNRQLLQVDSALASLPTLLSTVAGGARLESEAANRVLRASNYMAFAFRDLFLVRPDGQIWASARPHEHAAPLPIPVADLTDATRPGSVVIAGPVLSETTGEWSVFLARPVAVPGQAGIEAVAEVPVPLLVRLLADAVEVPNLTITLERANGQVVAKLPHDETMIGQRHVQSPARKRADGIAFDVGDTPPSLAVARQTLYGGLVVTLTRGRDGVLADWTRDRDRLVLVFGLAGLIVIGSATSLAVGLGRQERLERERMVAQNVLENAIEAMSDGFVMWDADDRLVTCNQRYLDLYDRSGSVIRPGARFEDIVREGAQCGQYPQAGSDLEGFVRDTVAWHQGCLGALERLLPDGRWLMISERRTATGGIVGIRTDITALKQTSAALASANERVGSAMAELRDQNAALRERDTALRIQNLRFDAALNNMSHGLLMTDSDERLIVANRRFLELFGLREGSIRPGMRASEIFAIVEGVGSADADIVRAIRSKGTMLSRDRRSGTFPAVGADGRAFSVSQQPLEEGGWVATFADVTERHEAERQVRFLAHHDALTRLPNRVAFRSKVEEILGKLEPRGERLAVLYIDLDDFKTVNDTLGHPIGDALLDAVGQRLRHAVRDSDLVARLGGDEFAVTCLSSDVREAAFGLGSRIIAAIAQPYRLSGHTVTVGASIGVALAEADATGSSVDALLKSADMALYEAKSEGRGRCRMFDPEMERKLLARLELEGDLRAAIERREFEVAYQPLVDLAGMRVAGFEALVRWRHPVRGLVSPAEFIPVAEQTGAIGAIGAFVLREACRAAARWPEDVRVAVNLSPVQLRSDDLVDSIRAVLAETGLPAARLELEVTESALLQDNARTLDLLIRLRDLGLRIVLDDFGTGFSSLSHLRMFPFDKIKIDQSFVREMPARTDCAAIVGSLVELANRLGIRTTAEGVETVEQLDLVRSAGCGEAQGYLIGRPSTEADAAGRVGTRPGPAPAGLTRAA